MRMKLILNRVISHSYKPGWTKATTSARSPEHNSRCIQDLSRPQCLQFKASLSTQALIIPIGRLRQDKVPKHSKPHREQHKNTYSRSGQGSKWAWLAQLVLVLRTWQVWPQLSKIWHYRHQNRSKIPKKVFNPAIKQSCPLSRSISELSRRKYITHGPPTINTMFKTMP